MDNNKAEKRDRAVWDSLPSPSLDGMKSGHVGIWKGNAQQR